MKQSGKPYAEHVSTPSKKREYLKVLCRAGFDPLPLVKPYVALILPQWTENAHLLLPKY